MKSIKKYMIVFLFPVIALTGCELFGLEVQTPYEYDFEAGMYNNELNTGVWEFIQSRPDLFSLLIEGIEYAEMQDMYHEAGATYMLLADKAFNSATAADLSYFSQHKLIHPENGTEYTPTSLRAYPKEQVRELLLYHIVKGAWTWSNLPSIPTWYNTYAPADTARMNLYLLKDRNPNIVFNNFDGHYKTEIKARTTNLKASNGSYVHVMESWIDRPTTEQYN